MPKKNIFVDYESRTTILYDRFLIKNTTYNKVGYFRKMDKSGEYITIDFINPVPGKNSSHITSMSDHIDNYAPILYTKKWLKLFTGAKTKEEVKQKHEYFQSLFNTICKPNRKIKYVHEFQLSYKVKAGEILLLTEQMKELLTEGHEISMIKI